MKSEVAIKANISKQRKINELKCKRSKNAGKSKTKKEN